MAWKYFGKNTMRQCFIIMICIAILIMPGNGNENHSYFASNYLNIQKMTTFTSKRL